MDSIFKQIPFNEFMQDNLKFRDGLDTRLFKAVYDSLRISELMYKVTDGNIQIGFINNFRYSYNLITINVVLVTKSKARITMWSLHRNFDYSGYLKIVPDLGTFSCGWHGSICFCPKELVLNDSILQPFTDEQQTQLIGLSNQIVYGSRFKK